jgi:hypothetical protein
LQHPFGWHAAGGETAAVVGARLDRGDLPPDAPFGNGQLEPMQPHGAGHRQRGAVGIAQHAAHITETLPHDAVTAHLANERGR